MPLIEFAIKNQQHKNYRKGKIYLCNREQGKIMQVLMARAVVQIVKFIVWLETREDNDFNETESNILFY